MLLRTVKTHQKAAALPCKHHENWSENVFRENDNLSSVASSLCYPVGIRAKVELAMPE